MSTTQYLLGDISFRVSFETTSMMSVIEKIYWRWPYFLYRIYKANRAVSVAKLVFFSSTKPRKTWDLVLPRCLRALLGMTNREPFPLSPQASWRRQTRVYTFSLQREEKKMQGEVWVFDSRFFIVSLLVVPHSLRSWNITACWCILPKFAYFSRVVPKSGPPPGRWQMFFCSRAYSLQLRDFFIPSIVCVLIDEDSLPRYDSTACSCYVHHYLHYFSWSRAIGILVSNSISASASSSKVFPSQQWFPILVAHFRFAVWKTIFLVDVEVTFVKLVIDFESVDPISCKPFG